MPGLLEGQVAIVTGAARGQGRSECVRLAEEGADIIAMDICRQLDTVRYPIATPEDLAETVELVQALDRRVIATETDVRDGGAVRAAVDAGVAELGRLDIVVANAGIGQPTPALEVGDDLWRDTLDTHLTGGWNTCRAALPHLLAGGRGGSIILISSNAAHIGYANLSHYSASKAGLCGLMRSLAVEFGPQSIRVNTIHQTGVNTPMIHSQVSYDLFVPDGSAVFDPAAGPPAAVVEAFKTQNVLPIPWIEPVDMANAVVFLASDQARYITGTELRVDAGQAAK